MDGFDGIIFGVLIGAALVLILALPINDGLKDSIEELGQSICDQEYGLDFDYYSDGTLHCTIAEQTVPYDGIQIDVGPHKKGKLIYMGDEE